MSSRTWRCGTHELELDRTLIMGILNATPDSFSDGGMYDDPAVATPHVVMMCNEGADIVDVGGESTRPGAAPVSSAEEIERVVPTLRRIVERNRCPISIDTRHADVARAAIDAGAEVINDISGFRDPKMIEFAASCDAGVVVMHMLGEPGTMQEDPQYGDVVGEIGDFLTERADALVRAGVDRSRICIDPGIGFGKTLDHNLEILRELPHLAELGYPVLVGVSRKSMLGALTGVDDPARRVEAGLGAAVWAALNGADVLRVHDVRETVHAVRVAEAIRG